MPRTEVIANGDGTFTLECGGGHARHLKDGAWVDDDLTWHEFLDRLALLWAAVPCCSYTVSGGVS
jgi:hypothetical protein